MKKKLLYKGFGFIVLLMMLSVNFMSCDDIPPIGDETTDRLFSPINLTATATASSIDVSWYNLKGVESYHVELFAKDSLALAPEHLVASLDIPENKYTFTNVMSGTRYTVAVTATGYNGINSSIASAVTVSTPKENILTFDPSSITKNSITLDWPANATVTHIKIVPSGGGDPLEYTITDAEKAAGTKVCDGLAAETAYTARLHNGENERGSVTFQTLMDGTVITPETSGISDLLNSAQDGEVFVFAPGDYSAITNIQLTIADKSIELKSQNSSQKASIYIRFIVTGKAQVSVKSLIINGNKIEGGVLTEGRGDYYVFDIGAVNDGSVSVEDCEIRNFSRSLVRGTAGAGPVNSIVFDNCIIENVCMASNEFIDLRTTQVKNIQLLNSTFISSPSNRHFLRSDAIDGFTGQTVLINHCTFYNLQLGANRLIYSRIAGGSVTMKNSIVEKSSAGNKLQADNLVVDYNYYYDVKNGGTADPDSETSYITGFPLDHSKVGTVSAFTDAATGNFTLTATTEARTTGEGGAPAGDPRWK